MTITLHPPSDPSASQPGQPAAQPGSAPAAPPGVEYETDKLGRVLGVRKITPLDRMQLSRMLGKEASNQEYMGYVYLAASCCSIDGVAQARPALAAQAEALVQRLGEEGIEAISNVQMRWMGVTTEDIEETGGDIPAAIKRATDRKQQEVLAAAKNSLATQI